MNKRVNQKLYDFAVESNRIENIHAEDRHLTHYHALDSFIALQRVEVQDLERFVKTIEPRAFLRTEPEHRVWIGGCEAPSSAESLQGLRKLLNRINEGTVGAHEAHLLYEILHPFIDGNGRSGRALWLWMMTVFGFYDLRYGFLRMFYYQTLTNAKAEGLPIYVHIPKK